MKKVFVTPQTKSISAIYAGQMLMGSEQNQHNMFPAPERNAAGKLYI